jgi:hypothetical protein
MGPLISADQRDALYRRALDQLRAFDDLLQAVDAGEMEAAYRLGRRMTDALRLIQEELGWEPVGGSRELRHIPPQDLLPTLSRIRDDATLQYESLRPELEAVRAPAEETALIRDTCAELALDLRQSGLG